MHIVAFVLLASITTSFWVWFGPIALGIGACVTVIATIIAGIHVGNSKRRDETISTQANLITTLKDQREEDLAEILKIQARMHEMETKLDMLSGKFAKDMVTAIIEALPAVLDRYSGNYVREIHDAAEKLLKG